MQCLPLHGFICAFPETGLGKRTTDTDWINTKGFSQNGLVRCIKESLKSRANMSCSVYGCLEQNRNPLGQCHGAVRNDFSNTEYN